MTNLNMFWTWIVERHAIWYARHVEALPPPWTDDPILRAYRFTNVYRRLDPGTDWLVEHLVAHRDASADETLLNTLAYRQGLREDSKAYLGWLRVGRRGLLDERRVFERMASFGPGHPYTGAYLLGNAGIPGPKRVSWPTLWSRAAATLAARRADRTVVPWQDLGRRELLAFLRGFQGIGPFVSYQVVLDLCYPEVGLELAHGNDGYALLGPGARKGIDLLPTPDYGPGDLGYNDRVIWLQGEQDRHLSGVMRGWDDGALDYVYLDRSDMENCCCEFGRYHEAVRTDGQNLRRRFGKKVAT